MKLCLDCKFCQLDPATPHYSDLTPGDPLVFRCAKGRWNLGDDSNKREMKSALLKAEACAHYTKEPK